MSTGILLFTYFNGSYCLTDGDFDGIDYCASSPCKSQATCVNDRMHQYYCICLVESDLSRHCTDGELYFLLLQIFKKDSM